MVEQRDIKNLPKTPTIKVILQVGNQTIDASAQGLVSLEFDRYSNNPADRSSGILTELNMVLFDSTGYDLLTTIQKEKMLIKYGFEVGDESDVSRMSPPYEITPTRYNVNYNNRGVMVGIGGFGTQIVQKWPAETYIKGTKIKDIITLLAFRNGWDIGENGSNINIAGELTGMMTKTPEETDFEFISSQLLPLASTTTVVRKELGYEILQVGRRDFYTAVLDHYGGKLELHVFPYNKKPEIHNVWEYSYGLNTSSQIVSLTNRINFDWLLSGIVVNIPLFEDNVVLPPDERKEHYTDILQKKKDEIIRLIERQALKLDHLENLTFNINFVDPEEVGYKDEEQIITEVIDNILNTVNTIELQVIGNPHIRALDIIRLTAINKEGMALIQNGDWRVIGIKEVINLQEYTTHLKLVREFYDR